MKELLVFLVHHGTGVENNLSISEKRKKIWAKNAAKEKNKSFIEKTNLKESTSKDV